MERTRKIAASPVRPASETWTVIKTLLADSLERSPHIPEASVATALAPLDGIASALIASGHLASAPVVLTAGDLRLNVYAVRGDDAFTIEENLSLVPGTASAPEAWRLYVHAPVHLRETVDTACTIDAHLISGKPPAVSESASAAGAASRTYSIDPAALQRM